jgi:hypothetical protein
MEMLQVGFMVVGVFILWSTMNLTAPAPVTPNDVTGELNSILEFIQKIRNKPTPLAASDRRKQAAVDKVFGQAEDEIQELLSSIDKKGELIKARSGTDEVEYNQAWDDLTQSIEDIKANFLSNLEKVNQDFGGMQSIHQAIGSDQQNVKQILQDSINKSRDANQKLLSIYEMYQ